MDDLTSNIIDLQERAALLRARAIAKDVAVAAAELESLRTSLRALNLIIQVHEMSGRPLEDQGNIYELLDAVTRELTECMAILTGLPDDPPPFP